MIRRLTYIFLLLAAFGLTGCGSSFQDQPSGQQNPQNPTVGTATIEVNHVLARAVPSSIDSFRFTGVDANGQTVFGPVTRPRAAKIILPNVPTSTVGFLIEYLSEGAVVGRFTTSVALTAGETFVINDPAWVDVTDVGAATRLGFLAQPSVGAPGQILTPALRVAVLDASGDLVANSTAPVTLAIASGNGTLGGTVTVNAAGGIATFSNITLSANGAYTLTASSNGLTAATSAPITVSTSPVAAALRFTTQPTNSGAALGQIRVSVVDQFGAAFTNYSGPVTLSLGTNSTGASLQGTLTVNAVNGVATFNNVTVSLAGDDYTLVASAPGLTPATSIAFDIVNGQLNRVAFSLVETLAFDPDFGNTMETGDYNGDGRPDALVASSSNSTAYVLLQGAAGGLTTTTVNIPGLRLARTGDVNGDDIDDLVVLTGNSPTAAVAVMVGAGDGTFGPLSASTPLGADAGNPIDFVLSDVNGDGLADALFSVPVDGEASIVVCLADNGGFAAPLVSALNTPLDPGRGLAVGNVIGSAAVDVVVTVDDEAQILLGNGTGQFTFDRALTVGSAPDELATAVALADFDDDGAMDLVVYSSVGTSLGNNGGNLTTFHNDAGAFAQNSVVTAGGGGGARSLGTADFDGDGIPDVYLVAGQFIPSGSNGLVSLFLTTADGGLSLEPSASANVPSVAPVNAADLNGDGFLDILVALNQGDFNRLNGDGQGGLLPAIGPVSRARTAAAGDLDGNGTFDLVTATPADGSQSNSTGQVSVYTRRSTGEISSSPVSGFPANTLNAIALGDADGDGDLDLFGSDTSASTVRLFLNDGTATFSTTPITIQMGKAGPGTLEVADLNGDGYADPVICTPGTPGIAVALSTGPATYGAASNLTTAPCFDIDLTDLDGDGDIDIVGALGPQGISLIYNNAGAFTTTAFSVPEMAVDVIAAGDLDGDGFPDLAAAQDGSNGAFGTVATFLNDGEGAVGPAQMVDSPGLREPIEAQIADVNGDGVLDILVVDSRAYGAAVLTGTGDGVTFGSGSMIHTGGLVQSPRSLVLIDVDGDGSVEPLFAVSAGGTLVSLLTLLGLSGLSWLAFGRKRAASAL